MRGARCGGQAEGIPWPAVPKTGVTKGNEEIVREVIQMKNRTDLSRGVQNTANGGETFAQDLFEDSR